MVYKGFIARYHFDDNRASYIAKVINTSDTIICNGKSPKDLKKSLIDCLDLYLDLYRKKGIIKNSF